METPTDEVARLDIAARAVISKVFISGNRWWVLFINLCLTALVFASNDRFTTPLIAPAFAVCAVFATVVLWVNWQYKLYVPALFCFAIAIGCVLLGKTFITPSDRIYGILMSSIYGYAFWTLAAPFATVNAPGWEKEQSQVAAWWRVLTTPERDKDVIEFSAGNFWTGYYTYRLLRPGPYWVVAKLWKGRLSVRSNYSVRELSAVTFMTLPTGEKQVTIGNRTMRAAIISMPDLASAKEPPLPKSA